MPHICCRLCLPSLLLAFAACGDATSDASDGWTTVPSGPTNDTTATTATVPTTSDAASTADSTVTATTQTATDATDATDTTDTTNPVSSTDATDTTDTGTSTDDPGTTGAVSTSEADTTGDTSTGNADSTGAVDSTGDMCPEGTEGCPCGPNASCDAGLACQGDTCVVAAMPVCGNGVVEGNEACDDGNQQNFDNCANDCTLNMFTADACGFLDDGVWLEIDYKNAGSIYSPKWTASPTPGFGLAQWAPDGSDWPIIHAKGPPKMTNDNIGWVADISSGQWLRIMFGLATLQSYESATVCITGRSISVGSSVTVDLRNPALGLCGAATMLSNSWQVHAGGVTMPANCLAPGNDFQALQIQPNGGSSRLGLRSARITLHKPVF